MRLLLENGIGLVAFPNRQFFDHFNREIEDSELMAENELEEEEVDDNEDESPNSLPQKQANLERLNKLIMDNLYLLKIDRNLKILCRDSIVSLINPDAENPTTVKQLPGINCHTEEMINKHYAI